MKNKIIPITALLIVVALLAYTSAAGIVSPYWSDHPLYMNYGETKVVNFNFQNMVGKEDITAKAEITKGNDIATLSKDTFTAKAGTKDTMIPVTIKIPKDYDKSLRVVELEVKTISEDTGEMITLGAGWTTSFNVMLSEKPVEKSSLITVIIILVIAIVIALIIIFALLLRKRRR